MKIGASPSGGAFNIWRDNPPPRETWVWVKYKLVGDTWQIVKTCKRGCCVHASYGCLLLPKYWKLASDAEGAAELAEWHKGAEADADV